MPRPPTARPAATAWALVPLLVLGASGCLGVTLTCSVAPLEVRLWPDPVAPGAADGARGWHAVAWLPHAPADNLTVEATGTGGWTGTVEPLATGPGPALAAWRVGPGAQAGDATLRVTRHDPDERCSLSRSSTVPLAPAAGEVAAAGQGVHVLTAGFWPNGTLFYTNIQALHDSDWPRAGWYGWEGADPLPVYVYDQEPSERPPWWGDPQGGTPAAGTVPGLGYFVTIPGFNAALKEASTAMTYVAVLTPEEGYTRAGNEDHPLHGAPLVFVVQVLDVVDAPCPAPTAPLCALPA